MDYKMTESEIDKLCQRVAEKTVNDTLLKLGMSIGDPIEFQKDMAFLRSWRQSSDSVKRQGFITMTIVLTTGFLGLLYTFFKGGTS